MSIQRDKLQRSLGGISDMKKVPDFVFIIDTNYESLAIKESIKLNIPIIAAERNSPDLFKYTKNSKLNRFLASLSLFFADNITAQFNSYKKKRTLWTFKFLCRTSGEK